MKNDLSSAENQPLIRARKETFGWLVANRESVYVLNDNGYDVLTRLRKSGVGKTVNWALETYDGSTQEIKKSISLLIETYRKAGLLF